MVLPKDLTPVEEYLLKKFALLKKKKRAIQKEKEKNEAIKTAKPGIKRAAPEPVHPPEDAKEIAKKLIASGTVKIKKDPTHREFKRTKLENRRISLREGQQGPNSNQQSANQSSSSSTSQKPQIRNLYDSFVPEGRRGSSDSGSRGYGHDRERKRGKTIFVKAVGLTENILNTSFDKFGKVERTHFEKEKCHGFVTFDSYEAAEKAAEEMDGLKVSHVFMKVSMARRQGNLDDSHSYGRGQPFDSRDGRGGPSQSQIPEARQLISYEDI
ncbi:negative elongation factor E-like isoform X2 [Actinia tenebrosa]|uniref:Negative elongation factor E n=1 Tax=Actinia tenebrosa TaxID=6105 RepID=A0A6P8HZT0_ACTTE|nr:negative elongation factor E-like isoform X2 [Actinia tenebrosa]